MSTEVWRTPPVKFDFNEHIALRQVIKKRREELAKELRKKTVPEQSRHHMQYEEQFLQSADRKLELAAEVNSHVLAVDRLTTMLAGGVLDEPEPE